MANFKVKLWHANFLKEHIYIEKDINLIGKMSIK